MKLVVGLGNPGARYETTRHNIGFLALDRLIEAWKAQGPLRKNSAEVYQTLHAGEQVLLIKPQTYMNRSGLSVGPFFQFYKIHPTDLLVIHDDLDLPLFTTRIKTGGGSGGHNGIRSIDEALGAGKTRYHRLRIGIGRPIGDENRPKPSASDYVLDPFTDDELSNLDPLLDDLVKAAELILEGKVHEAMNQYNKRKRT